MDQLKQQLAIVLKYGFWIGSSIVLLGSLLTWYLSTSTLSKENESQTSKLNGAVSSVTSVRGELDTQPNDLSHAAMEGLIEARKSEVLASWKKLFEKQQSLLTWPTEELTSDLTDRFTGLIPIERYVLHPTAESDEIPPYLRKQYQTYIGNALPDIAAIAEAEWSASLSRSPSAMMGGTSMYGGPMGPTVDITGSEAGPLVKWSSASQQGLLEDLFPWRGKGTPPSTLEVYYSQENLWILKQMLQIIANVNGDAQQPYQAKIHEIAKISIGSKVSFTAGTISKPGEGAVGGMGGMDYMDMDMEGMDDYGGGDMYGGDMAGGGVGGLVAVDPADNRYVNAQNEPVTGAALRTALTSNSAADAEIAVAKRVPVMMALQIDQRYIQQLLAECGSAPLMIQVKQVRILPKEGLMSIGGGMGGMEGMEDEMGMDEMGMDDMGMGMESGMGMGLGMGAAVAKEPPEEFPLDMAVELYGLIYMYNPQDPVKLGVEEIDQDSVIEGVTNEPKQTEPIAPAAPAEVNDVLPTPPAADAAQPPADATQPPADATQPNGQPPADAAAPPVAETGATATPPPAILLPLP
jgi:hypothetical protein